MLGEDRPHQVAAGDRCGRSSPRSRRPPGASPRSSDACGGAWGCSCPHRRSLSAPVCHPACSLRWRSRQLLLTTSRTHDKQTRVDVPRPAADLATTSPTLTLPFPRLKGAQSRGEQARTWDRGSRLGEWGEVCSMTDREHEVAAYDDAAALVTRVADFVATSLRRRRPRRHHQPPRHRHAVDDLLADLGVDAVRARRDGTLTTLDADESMASLPGRRAPRPRPASQAVVASAAADRRETGQRLRRDGRRALGARRGGWLPWSSSRCGTARSRSIPIRLLCAYPGELLADAELGDVARMCDLHDHVSLAGRPRRRRRRSRRTATRPLQRAPPRPRGGRVRARLRARRAHRVGPRPPRRRRRPDHLRARDQRGHPRRLALPDLAGPDPADVVRVSVEDGSSAWPDRTRRARATRTAGAWPSSRPCRERSGLRLHPRRQGRLGRAQPALSLGVHRWRRKPAWKALSSHTNVLSWLHAVTDTLTHVGSPRHTRGSTTRARSRE